jgi:hypothetical protein
MTWAWHNRPQLRHWYSCTCSHPDCGQSFRQLGEHPPTVCFAWVHYEYTGPHSVMPEWVKRGLLDGSKSLEDLHIKRVPVGAYGNVQGSTRCRAPLDPARVVMELPDKVAEYAQAMRRLRAALGRLVWDGVAGEHMLQLAAEELRQQGDGCPECAELAQALDELVVDQPLVPAS